MSLLLVRHGETDLNRARILQPAHTPLSALGRVQALAVARRMVGLLPVAILSSDLPRALQTAQAIASATGLTIQTTALLHERSFGDLRGRPYDTLDHDPIASEGAAPGGESLADFDLRVAAAFGQATALRAGLNGPLVVVTHGLVIARMLLRHARLAPATAPPTHLGNTSITQLQAQPPHMVELLNCSRHLDEGFEDAPRGLSGG